MRADKTVVGTMIGVDWNHKGQGIGSQLINAGHEELKRRGIKQYVTGVWEKSIKMFDRAGVNYTTSPDPQNPTQTIATVYLD